MPPTIRIDEEVYAWLQQKGRPFEDTPNSVLRRIAGLDATEDHEESEQQAVARRGAKTRSAENARSGRRTMSRGRSGLTGQQLNEDWKVGARHALYHADGTWFENLERFPGALFDPHGYVLFETAESFKKNPYVKIGKKTNVVRGISKSPGYVRKE